MEFVLIGRRRPNAAGARSGIPGSPHAIEGIGVCIAGHHDQAPSWHSGPP
ncbi:MAG: hypothetical protein ABFR82_17210 [Nitrospirota bacterium]